MYFYKNFKTIIMKKNLFSISKSIKALIGIINLKFVISLILLSSFLPAKSSNFQAAYNCNNLSSITSVAISEDGFDGFMAVVNGIDNTPQANQIFNLVKLDAQFNVQWTKVIDYTQNSFPTIIAYDIKHDNQNGGYALCGQFFSTNSNSNHGFMMKTDDNGDIVWFKDVVDQGTSEYCFELKSIVIHDDEYIACGNSIDIGSNNIYKGFIIDINSVTLVTLWAKTIYDNITGSLYFMNDISLNLAAGGVICTGTRYANLSNIQNVIAAYDFGGNTVFEKTYDTYTNISGEAICVDEANAIAYVTGNFGNNDYYLHAVDATNGNIINTKAFNIDIDFVKDILFYDSQLYYTGHVYTNNNNFGLLMQSDVSGNPVFSALYSATGTPYEDIRFEKMIYRTSVTNPSIIKIGRTNNFTFFYITETYMPYNEDCYNEEVANNTANFDIYRTDIISDYTGNDHPDLAINPVNTETTNEEIMCNPFNWTPIQYDLVKNDRTIDGISYSTTENTISLPALYSDAVYTIYSMDGRSLKTGSIRNYNSIDISILNKGIYLLSLQLSDKQTKIFKFIK